jgi:predicted ester cyclase
VIQFFTMFRAAFSDLRMNVEDMAASGDTVWARVRITGTNDGEFMGMPATGKPVDFHGVDIVRFNDEDLAAEHWGITDSMTMMQQLGVVPEGPPA